MSASRQRRVLTVANRTSSTPGLLDRVRDLAREQPSSFVLLIPDAPRSAHTDWTLEVALPLLERAARGSVRGLTGGDDALQAVRRAVEDERPDLVLISTLPRRVSQWLRRDLPRRIEALGVAVEVISQESDPLVDKDTAAFGLRTGFLG